MSAESRAWFLAARRDAHTLRWWMAIRDREDIPLVVRDLIGRAEIIVAHEEIATALDWARTVDGWDEEHPALIGHNARA